jgi:hypothetical protein
MHTQIGQLKVDVSLHAMNMWYFSSQSQSGRSPADSILAGEDDANEDDKYE